jgi:hypothetical protein
VWNLDSKAPLAAFTCDSGALSCVFFGDDKLIASDYGSWVHFLSLEEPKRKD